MAIDLVQHPAVEGRSWWRIVHFGLVCGAATDLSLVGGRREIDDLVATLDAAGWTQVGGIEEIAATVPGAGEIAMLRVPFCDAALAARLTRFMGLRRPARESGREYVGGSYVLTRSYANPDFSRASLDAESRFWQNYAVVNPLASDDRRRFAADLYLAFSPWNRDECAAFIRAEMP
jgi:hypothetical protein